MKNIITLAFVILISISPFAQSKLPIENSPNAKDKDFTYRLFPTQNMWTFIKLNTRNGQIWQVQYDIQGTNRFEVYINSKPLVIKEYEEDGRFMLHSTQNIYNFILIDQIDGRLWQAQWSTEAKNRGLILLN